MDNDSLPSDLFRLNCRSVYLGVFFPSGSSILRRRGLLKEDHHLHLSVQLCQIFADKRALRHFAEIRLATKEARRGLHQRVWCCRSTRQPGLNDLLVHPASSHCLLHRGLHV